MLFIIAYTTNNEISINGIPVINNWNPHVNIITIVIPKSGCNNNKDESRTIDAIDHIQPGNLFFSIHNDNSQALKTTYKGLPISLG